MTTVKNVFNKIFSYAGGVSSVILLIGLISCGAFSKLEGSYVLIILTVLLLFCGFIGIARLYSTRIPKKEPGILENNSVLLLTLFVVLGIFVRGIVFILIDVPLVDVNSSLSYVFCAINIIMIFLIAKALWGFYSAVLASFLYSLWGSFEILTVSCDCFDKYEIILLFAGQATALLSFLLIIHAIYSKSQVGAIMLTVFSGITAGISAGVELSFVALFFAAVAFCIMSKSRVRRSKNNETRLKPMKSVVLCGIYVASFIIPFVCILLVLYFCNIDSNLSYIKEFSFVSVSSAFELFVSLDSKLFETFRFVSYPRNYFANYLHLCTFAVLLVLAILGCYASGKKRDVKSMSIAMLLFVVVIFAVLGGGDFKLLLSVMPWILLLAVYGMNSSAEFLIMYEWIYRAGIRNPAFGQQFLYCNTSDEKNVALEFEPEPESESESEEVTGESIESKGDPEGTVAAGDERERLLNSLADVITK